VTVSRTRIVVDTQVFLRALISRHSASHRLLIKTGDRYDLCVSQGIIDEIIDVLTRSKIRRKFSQITDKDVQRVAQMLENAVQIPLAIDEIEPVCRDPKDDIFLACARKANAAYLVSEDNDLLVLKTYHDTLILNVIAFLQTFDDKDDSTE